MAEAAGGNRGRRKSRDALGTSGANLTAALPVAGNVYMLAQHYGVAPQRVSAAILVSTTVSIVTVSLVVGWVSAL